MAKILFLMMFPFVCFSQITPREDIPVNNILKEKENLDTKRKASYNLEEIKVRWKKAALENCPGVPCVTTTVPGAPTGVTATAGNASASVAFTAPASNGGSVITGYTVTSSPGGITATGATLTINVTGLTNGTAYTLTVVATNAIGNSVPSTASTAVTPVAPPACGSITSVSDVDGNPYETVSIGTQCWTKTNLKTTRYNDGITSIPDETANAGWGTLGYGSRTEFVGVTGYVSTYGYLYNGYAVAGIITPGGPSIKNICPVGWRVPSNSDWNKLVIFIDSGADTTSASFVQSSAITSLKKNDASWFFNTGTNTSGFSALPGGYRGSSFFPFSNRYDAAFWSTTELPMQPNFNLVRDIQEPFDTFRKVPQDKSFGLSVRCLKD